MIRRSSIVVAGVLCLGIGVSACTEKDQADEPTKDAGTEPSGPALDGPELQSAIAELGDFVATNKSPAHRRLSFNGGTWETGQVTEGLSPRIAEAENVPQAQWVVDCHDRASGDILSSTTTNTLDGLQDALNACTSAGQYVELCMTESEAVGE